MSTYYVYGWNLDDFEDDLFVKMVPKNLKGKSRRERLDVYFDEESTVNVFDLDEGTILGIVLKDRYSHYDLKERVLSSIDNRIGQLTSSKFDYFLTIHQPRIYEVLR